MTSSNTGDESSSLALQSLKILLVEDELTLNEMLTDYFVYCGATVISVTSAAQGLEVVQSQKPDILLSNIVLPDEDGYSLIQKIRHLPPERGGKTPAIAITASASETNRSRILKAGFQACLFKPLEPKELIELIVTLTSAESK